MKLTREAMAHYLDPSFKNDLSAAGTAGWEVLGDDIEEMSMEMNPDTEQKKNILGETKTVDKGYEPSMDADPYYADPTKKIYPKVIIIMTNTHMNTKFFYLMTGIYLYI